MADLTSLRTTQQMMASGFAGLLGLFAGLCAIFAALVAISDWQYERTLAGWPLVSAVVDRADVITSSRADGGGKEWKLRYRVRYEVNGEQRTATLTSRTTSSEEVAAGLKAWTALHRKGSSIDVRYDPSQKDRAEFASAEVSNAIGRTRTDLLLFVFAAGASVGLLALAKHLRSREALIVPTANSGGVAVGLACAAMGLMLVGFAINAAIHATGPVAADNFMAIPAGLMFVFAGALMALPPNSGKWQNFLATLLVTCFALTLDWVAFGPGERKFTGSFVGIGFIPSEFLGRALFGVFAVLLNLWAIKMWIDQCGRMLKSSGADTV